MCMRMERTVHAGGAGAPACGWCALYACSGCMRIRNRDGAHCMHAAGERQHASALAGGAWAMPGGERDDALSSNGMIARSSRGERCGRREAWQFDSS